MSSQDVFFRSENQSDPVDSKKHNNNNNSNNSNRMVMIKNVCAAWKGRENFLKAQGYVACILTAAYVGNNWPHSYPRNDNKDPIMFWCMNLALLVGALCTLKHEKTTASTSSSKGGGGLQLLSRSQTEEWKGWMQWAFIMYHYYRASFIYNEIRVFVSAYVWMTGFGNFLYFDKKQDFSFHRAITMWLRINYFPLMLCLVVRTKLDEFYIVPLHTTVFFITMATCYVSKKLGNRFSNKRHRNMAAVALCLLAHVVFYETPLVNILHIFSYEIWFRFQADKYSAWVGIFTALWWDTFQGWLQYYNTDTITDRQRVMTAAQIGVGLLILLMWYSLFGYMTDKHQYNPIHPFVFWIPIAGWLLIRNSSKYFTEVHSTLLEFFGKITLETYVLQFHLFMCHHVQNIPVVVPGSGPTGPWLLKTFNMLLCGVIFVYTAYWARHHTVTTQETISELLGLVHDFYFTKGKVRNDDDNEDVGKNDKDNNNNKNTSTDGLLPDHEMVPLATANIRSSPLSDRAAAVESV